jgi:hypothetical protein
MPEQAVRSEPEQSIRNGAKRCSSGEVAARATLQEISFFDLYPPCAEEYIGSITN